MADAQHPPHTHGHDHAHGHGHDHGHYHPPAGDQGPPPRFSDPAQESLVRALHASFNILRLLMIVLVFLYALSGVFRVGPGEQGLVARLGKLREIQAGEGTTQVFQQGWYWSLPDPFDRKFTLPGTNQDLRIVSFVFSHPDAATRPLADIVGQSRELTPGIDGAMLTGDRNLSHGRWEVEYQIANAADFVKNVGRGPGDFGPLLQRLTESAVVREVAGRTVEEVTRRSTDVVRESVHRRLQQALDDLHTGVRVVQVKADTTEPGAVRPAFLDVSAAENERLRLQEEAREAETETLSRAAGNQYGPLLELIARYGDAQLRNASEAELAGHLAEIDALLDRARSEGAGQVAVRLSEAEAQAGTLNETLRREYEQYLQFREQLRTQRRITLLNLWLQMRNEILGNKQNEIFYVPDTPEIEIHVKSDPQRRIELEEQAIRDRAPQR